MAKRCVAVAMLLLLAVVVSAHPLEEGAAQITMFTQLVISPDNTCGGTNGYTCNANDPLGGACCSKAGYCGRTEAYCAAGCQPSYGTCFAAASPPATPSGDAWDVPGVGLFTHAKTYDFAGATQLPSDFFKSTWLVNDAPLGHKFEADLVSVADGFLQLKVPGGQTAGPVRSAEIGTKFAYIMYASVRTTAILGDPAGTCNGMFFYKNDTQEIDIEFLSDASSRSNPGDGSRPMHYTNMPTRGGVSSHATGPARSDATYARHEYRIDWLPGRTQFFLDGVLQHTHTTNVPTVAGSWLCNNWGNGNPGWTGAPPKTDNVFKISKIVMYYNTTAS